MKDLYTNYISLGYFCEVAQDLEKLGLRNMSSPFDWGISYFPGVIEAIDNEFIGFMDYENLSQVTEHPERYHEDMYHFFFFHDFTKYKSLDEQYTEVKEKYRRRINRFLDAIKSPTLFVKYISIEELDSTGKSVELIWIENNYQHVLNVLKKSNSENDIIFIGDETVNSELIKIYHVQRDAGDCVSRSPIYNSEELYPLLSSVNFPGKEDNQKRYAIKAKKKSSLTTKIKKRVTSFTQSVFLKVYIHEKTYSGS